MCANYNNALKAQMIALCILQIWSNLIQESALQYAEIQHVKMPSMLLKCDVRRHVSKVNHSMPVTYQQYKY